MVLMTIMTASHVLMKVLACALMLRLSSVWVMIYLGGDMSLYFIYKALRRDTRYWLPLNGILSWIATVLSRLVIKVIVDFALIVQFRHPFELGGAFWSMNIVLNQGFCFVSILLYKLYLNETIVNNEKFVGYSVDDPLVRCNATDICNSKSTDICYKDDFICEETSLESSLWALVAGLFAISMISFGTFLKSINRKYLGTFFDTRTGKQFLCDNWRDGTVDSDRFYVFSKHASLYKSINEELKDWLSENWEKWEEEKPDWFTAKMIKKIPEEILPNKYKNSLGTNKSARRKTIDKKIKE